MLAPLACIAAIVLLIEGADVMGSLLWPWALCVPRRFRVRTVDDRPRAQHFVAASVRAGRRRAGRCGAAAPADPRSGEDLPAWLSMTLYWAAEIIAVYVALRMFGVHLSPARVVLAYGTGFVVTRRSLP